MKLFDSIEIVSDNYKKLGIEKGTKGAIVLAEIRDNSFEVELFDLPNDIYPCQVIKIKDMVVTESSDTDDNTILKQLPLQNPKWWCKVEDGYIVNLLGEKKNKIPYDYNS